MLASGLRDVLDQYPDVAAITVSHVSTVLPDGTHEPIANFQALNKQGGNLPQASQAFNEIIERSWAPQLFVNHMSAHIYGREDFAREIDRPLLAATTTSTAASTQPQQQDFITPAQADRVRSIMTAAMPRAPRATTPTPTPPPSQQPPRPRGPAL